MTSCITWLFPLVWVFWIVADREPSNVSKTVGNINRHNINERINNYNKLENIGTI